MPKITIKEFDKTKAAGGLYNNFSVLVPGYIDEQLIREDDTFDENGVCELANQKEFDEKIGQRPAVAQATIPAVPAVPQLNDGDFFRFNVLDTEPAQPAVPAVPELNEEEFYTFETKELLEAFINSLEEGYDIFEANLQSGSGIVGELKAMIGDSYYEFEPVVITEDYVVAGKNYVLIADDNHGSDYKPEVQGLRDWARTLVDTTHVYVANLSESAKVGYLKAIVGDYYYEFSRVNLNDDEYDPEGKNFVAISDIQVGSDETGVGLQMGNQIAYELLGLGYTVLYKRIKDNQDLNDKKENPVYDDFWEPLKDKSLYDFRYVVTGMADQNTLVNNAIINLANFINKNPDNSGRGDCTALCDIDAQVFEGKAQKNAILGVKEEVLKLTKSKYAAFFAPTVEYSNIKSKKAYENSTFPCSFHYLACAAKASEYYNEWYAIAGYVRGVNDFSIAGVGCKFGEEASNALAPRYKTSFTNLKGQEVSLDAAVNLIVRIKNNFYLWGNRTAEVLGDKDGDNGELKASHFLNIRQLCSTIKKQVYITCKKYTFDPNSDVLWINFCEDIRPLLEKMKSDQGITDYKFIKVKTPQKAVLKAKIRIVPIEAVEDFDISLSLEDSISGTVVGIDEEDE